MDHNYAIENHTAERYLLHELPEDERDAYEEHFFNCLVCAEEIKSASDFMETARQVVQAELHAPLYAPPVHHSWVWGSWLNWRTMLQPIPAMACILFLAVSVFSAYQNGVMIPQIKHEVAAQIVPHDELVLGNVHGDQAKASVTKPITLKFTIPTDSVGVDSYQADIVSNSGVRKYSFNISHQQAMDPVQIVLEAHALDSGKYLLVVSGPKGEVERLPFELE